MLRTLSVQLGAQVKQGDVIAELDAWDLEMSVLAAQSEVDLTQARLEQAKLVRAQQIATLKADLDVAKPRMRLRRLSVTEWTNKSERARSRMVEGKSN